MLRFADTITTPPGGFQYEDKATGFKVKTRSWRDCKAAVWKYRVANGGDVSPNWEFRLEEEMCLQNNLQGTDWCHDDERYFPPPGEGIGIGDVFRFLKSMAKLLAGGMNLVDQSEADRRAAICAECPLNQRVESCYGCSGVASIVNSIRGNRVTVLDDKLESCAACKCNNRVKVWVPLEAISNDGLNFPQNCWQRDGQSPPP